METHRYRGGRCGWRGGLAACDPVLHPTFAVKEDPSAPVTFDLLSGNGTLAVVRATGAGATVPAAGCWRVNRSDGSVVALPGCNRALRTSADGSRILLDTNSGQVLWSSGTTLTPPGGIVFSKDLTFGVFVDTDGAVKTWKTADKSVGLVETGFPRPAGTTSAQAKGISNDGRKVEYTLSGTNPIARFVDLDTATKIDRPNLTSIPASVTDTFSLAPSGAGFLQVHERIHIDESTFPPILVIDESWAELVAFPSGKLIRRYTNTTQEGIARSFISDDGGTAWLYRERIVADGGASDCPDVAGVASCVESSHAILINNIGAAVFDTGPHDVAAMNSFGNGRFLVFDKFDSPYVSFNDGGPSGPVQILDWLTHHVETLSHAATLNAWSANGQMSNDLRLVATTTTTGKGWYEYTTSP
ncbi:MAG: hypothetical protein M3Q30_05675 [Actinomycetota bacterium]|nr:hypothetical protein [Actinomycetota bacterium]